jgi:hypothetical protein
MLEYEVHENSFNLFPFPFFGQGDFLTARFQVLLKVITFLLAFLFLPKVASFLRK